VASGKARKRRQQTACGPLILAIAGNAANVFAQAARAVLMRFHQHITENPLAAMRPGEGMSVGALLDRD
jgi:hypothetical protein